MASLHEIIADEQGYADATQIDLGNGTVLTLGDFRKDYRSKDADYRQKTSRLADESRRLQEQQAAMQASYLEAEAKLAEWTKQLMQANPGMTQRQAEEALDDDPRYARLSKKFDDLSTSLSERDKKIEKLEQAIQSDQKARLIQAHQYTINQLKQQHGEFDAEELAKFAYERGIPRLDDAYYVKNREALREADRKAAIEEATPKLQERIKKELSQPILPTTRVVKPDGTQIPQGPGAMDKALAAALADSEIMGALSPGIPVF